ncbi:MAG: CARDB domain-containing protein [Snowella sp.]|nr:CARDB domain-containing protein [Snowella sp.]
MFTESTSPIVSPFASLEDNLSLWKDTLQGIHSKSELVLNRDNLDEFVAPKSVSIHNRLDRFGSDQRVPGSSPRNLNSADSLTGLSAQSVGASVQFKAPAASSSPDLMISSLSSSSSVNAGSTLSVSYTVNNQGNATAASNTTQFYLSTDNSLDAADTLIGSSAVSSISANKSKNISFSATVNSNLAPGNYYLFAKADGNNQVIESNESNNLISKAITINAAAKADLNINAIAPSSVLVGGTSLSLNYKIANLGNASAASSLTKFYLSTDALLDGADTVLGTDTVSSLAAGANTNRSVSLTLASGLNQGAYYLFAQADSGNTVSESNEANNTNSGSFSVTTLANWCTQNIKDVELSSLSSSLTTDGILSRQDMIDLFNNAKDNSVVDGTEFTDLKTLVANGKQLLGMQDYVYALSNDLVNGDTANTTSGIGNLFAGSTDTQMTNLVDKWFLGKDRPDTSYSYQYAQGALFQNGINVNDIKQGIVGDCYYLSTLSSIAQEKPSYIQDMFIDNGDNTFTVKFLNNGVNNYVTVDHYLPTDSNDKFVYASYGSSYTNTSNELWVALAEKAYAQLAESGWSRPAYNASTSTNSYAAIESGWMDLVIQEVTGLSTTSQTLSATTSMTQTALINLVNSNQILTAGFVYGDGGGLVVNNHAYTITAYNSTTGQFHLRNPWGYQDSDLTWSQLVSLQAVVQYSNT